MWMENCYYHFYYLLVQKKIEQTNRKMWKLPHKNGENNLGGSKIINCKDIKNYLGEGGCLNDVGKIKTTIIIILFMLVNDLML